MRAKKAAVTLTAFTPPTIAGSDIHDLVAGLDIQGPDDGIGMITQTLDELGLSENTIIDAFQHSSEVRVVVCCPMILRTTIESFA